MLMQQLQLTEVKIIEHMDNLAIQTQFITPIKTAYSTDFPTALKYYADEAVLIKKGESPLTFVQLDNLFKMEYVPYITTGSGNISDKIQGIHDAICPNMPMDGCLIDYTNYLILNPNTNMNNQEVLKEQNIMNTYMLLENYFSTVINYQIQGLVVLANAMNYLDTTGSTTQLYINQTFSALLADECNAYLNAVNYMIINLFDYRQQAHYVSDMQYRDFGIVPDTSFYNVLGRARFVCSLLQQASDINPDALCGSILTPFHYTDGTVNPPLAIDATYTGPTNGNMHATASTSQGFLSTFPYTRWTVTSSDQTLWTASPDNHYNCYYPAANAGSIKGGQYSILITDQGNPSFPWCHEKPITGKVTVKYYNPRHPDPTKATLAPTDSNTMPFGFFSSRWTWGFQRLSMGPRSSVYVPRQYQQFDDMLPNPYFQLTALPKDSVYLTPREGTTTPPFMHYITFSDPNQQKYHEYQFLYGILMGAEYTPPPGTNQYNIGFFGNMTAFITPVGNMTAGIGFGNPLNRLAFDDDLALYWGILMIPDVKNIRDFNKTFPMNGTMEMWHSFYNTSEVGGWTSIEGYHKFTLDWNLQAVYLYNYNIFQ